MIVFVNIGEFSFNTTAILIEFVLPAKLPSSTESISCEVLGFTSGICNFCSFCAMSTAAGCNKGTQFCFCLFCFRTLSCIKDLTIALRREI